MTNSADPDQFRSQLFAKTGHDVLSMTRVKYTQTLFYFFISISTMPNATCKIFLKIYSAGIKVDVWKQARQFNIIFWNFSFNNNTMVDW